MVPGCVASLTLNDLKDFSTGCPVEFSSKISKPFLWSHRRIKSLVLVSSVGRLTSLVVRANSLLSSSREWSLKEPTV